MSFEILSALIAQKKNPTVVGLDPRLDHLPPDLREPAEHDGSLESAADAILAFNKGLIDALADIVPAVKPQLACYEAFGVPGLAALRETMVYAASKGLYVIADAKRNDIGSTAEAYADAFLGETQVGGQACRPFPADCMTINPYLGSDGVLPFIERCKKYKRAVFALAKTSNASAGELQDRDMGGAPLYRRVAELAGAWGSEYVGLVVGATYPAQLDELRRLLPQTFFLIPGYGAQGGGATDVAPGFGSGGTYAIVNSSRAISCAWQKTSLPWREAARAEALEMRDALQKAVY
ncbi:MAG: orotidine-5'-phosphate decarboxylase [Peptococcaceae bacterium]|nr:orotidine-5'-phosphate decarboxylase [Peptococcaceae bacterium]